MQQVSAGVPDDSPATVCLRFLGKFKRFDIVGGSDRVLNGVQRVARREPKSQSCMLNRTR